MIMQVTSSIDKQPLSSINEKLIQAGEFLKLLQNDKRRLHSLRVFTQCTNIIDWIRKYTKGIASGSVKL